MNRRNQLDQLADIIRRNVSHRLDVALLTLVETLSELDPGDVVSYSFENIGICITPDYIEFVDINKSTSILTLTIK